MVKAVKQPENVTTELFTHQRVGIYDMELYEKQGYRELPDGSIITGRVGVQASRLGSGKTLMMIGLLARDKMPWDIKEYFIDKECTGGNNVSSILMFTPMKYQKRRCNVIVASPSVINHWRNEVSNRTKLSWAYIGSKNHIENVLVDNFDVVLVNKNFYNDFAKAYNGYAFKRVIFDEPDALNIPNMTSIKAGFMWMVSGTAELLDTIRNRKSFIKNMFSFFGTVHLDLLKFEVDLNIIKKSIDIPDYDIMNHQVLQNSIVKFFKDILTDRQIEELEGGNINGIKAELHGNPDDNIIDLVYDKLNHQLEEAEAKVEYHKNLNHDEKAAEYRITVSTIKQGIKSYNSQFKHLLSSCCPKCGNGSKDRSAVVLDCCLHMCCGKCFSELLYLDTETFEELFECPFCYRVSNSNMCFKYQNVGGSEEAKNDPIKTKNDCIIDQINKSSKESKFLIFSYVNRGLKNIENFLKKNGITVSDISGISSIRDRIINNFNNGLIKVLLINSRENGAGLNLQAASDVIIYQDMDPQIEHQCLARAVRYGQKNRVKVHRFIE